ncbi:NADP-dependent aldehyde dehydrogenase [Robiginitalea myxolifaciens]|uniref:NADP-dependent aldehyde dehydrogenase n=1 Tax=Robiginitalea myxolifaciens TaxID=400055 RepID=A0A1I6HBI3_9FLAO|nr:aldehyde dehydrogenase (NADP(+)) [Robiginitalea myxolifaciens]SFR51721.1 NADP-dependent aldehyde dehydrogenase [Robiginitalea myxolifaciens]
MSEITGKNYIGFEPSAAGDNRFQTFNPQENAANPWEFVEASEKEIDQAVGMAAAAFPSFKTLPGKRRAEFLRAISDEIEALGDALIQTYMLESGLPEGRAKGERGRTMGQLRAFADLIEEGSWVEAVIDTAQPDRTPVPKPDLRKISVPIGPIAVFGSSNFPLAYSTAGGDTASALAAGCPVVVKSHPMHAATGELVASAIVKAAQRTQMPEGVFSNLNSSGIEVGQQLVKHPEIKGVGFTGSIKAGTALYRLAAQREEPIPVFAEMGSINPVISLPGALAEKGEWWAEQYANSVALGVGQFCTNPGLILGLESEALEAFTQILGKELCAKDPACMLHPKILENYQEGSAQMSGKSGTQLVAEYNGSLPPNTPAARVMRVNGTTFLEEPALQHEVFGPFTLVVACEDEKELITVINSLGGQLTGTLLAAATEINQHPEVVSALQQKVGRLIFNGVPTGVEVCPAMQHGGPFPASTDSRFTAVGTLSIRRWVRPVSYQNWPQDQLPPELQDKNPMGLLRLVNGEATREPI